MQMGKQKNNPEQIMFKELPWDTEYFGISSARIDLKSTINGNDLVNLTSSLRKYSFITICNQGNDARNNVLLSQLNGVFLTDINIQLEKEIGDNAAPRIELPFLEIHKNYFSSDVKRICRETFRYSRFFNDPFLNREKAANVYMHWVESAFQKHDRHFVVYEDEGGIKGFILFNINVEESISTIELIAVINNQKTRGIGSKLICKLESHLVEKQVKTLKVGTQVDNYKALNFYVKNGFKICETNSVYHYWPNRKVEENDTEYNEG